MKKCGTLSHPSWETLVIVGFNLIKCEAGGGVHPVSQCDYFSWGRSSITLIWRWWIQSYQV